jgi:peptidyl-prolyl cis-trans isomerase C
VKIYLLTALLALSSLAMAQDTTPAPEGAAPAQTAPADPAAPESPAADPAQPDPAQPDPAQMEEADPTTVVATVDGTDYTLDEFNRAFRLAVARSANAQGIPYSAEMDATFAQYRPQFLDTFARQQVVLQLAQNSGVEGDDGAVDAQLTADRAQFPSDEEFTKALQGSGFGSQDEYRSSLQDQQLANAYLRTIRERFKFSDAVVDSFYSLNRASFTRKAEACVKHILVPTEAEAGQIVKDLAAGGDFAKIATQKSKDPGSAVKGGDLGCLAPGETVPEFDKASFQGPLNKVQSVKSQFGYHVLVVTKRTDAGLQPLTDVSGPIRDQLAADASQKYLNAQVNKLKLVLYKDRLPAAPAQTATPDAPAPGAAPTDAPAEPTPPSP